MHYLLVVIAAIAAVTPAAHHRQEKDAAAVLSDMILYRRSWLDDGTRWTASPATRPNNIAVVDSMRLNLRPYRAYVTARRGEYLRREVYTLFERTDGTLVVNEVRLYGHLRLLRTAQEPDVAGALSRVILFRREWVDADTRWNACSVYQALGRDEGFRNMLHAEARPLLIPDRGEPCVPIEELRAAMRPYNVATVDSLHLDGTPPRVHLTTRSGEHLRREEYSLSRLDRGEWGMSEIRFHGHLRVHLPGR